MGPYNTTPVQPTPPEPTTTETDFRPKNTPALPTIVFAIIAVISLGLAVFFLIEYVNTSNQVTTLQNTLNSKDQTILKYEEQISKLQQNLEEKEESEEESEEKTEKETEPLSD